MNYAGIIRRWVRSPFRDLLSAVQIARDDQLERQLVRPTRYPEARARFEVERARSMVHDSKELVHLIVRRLEVAEGAEVGVLLAGNCPVFADVIRETRGG